MQILLDTHSFLWFIAGDPRCSTRARELIADPTHDALLSIAGLWEIAIKVSLNKLILTMPFGELIPQQLYLNYINILAIELADLQTVAQLPFHHRDPFDRLLIAQSLTHQVPIVSADKSLDLYGIERIW
jgi:PIN domain nuclease of toxin-antitoxin system